MAPLLISDSSTRLLSRRRSTFSQNSKIDLKRPSAPDAQQEVQRLEALGQLHGREQAKGLQGLEILQAMLGARHPQGGVEVPQASRSLLDVGFLQVHRAAVLRMAALLLGELVSDVLLAPPSLECPPDSILEIGEHHIASGQEAGLQEGGPDREVRVQHVHRVAQGAAAVPHLEAQVPEKVEDVVEYGGNVFVDASGIEEHHVYVRGGVELPPAIAPQGHHGASLSLFAQRPGHALIGQPEELAHNGVDEVRVPGNHIQAARPTPVRRLDP